MFKVNYNGIKGCVMMSQPNVITKTHKVQKIYFLISLGMVVLSGLLFFIGSLYAKTVRNAPMVILYFATYFFYYHVLHIVFGIGSIFYYISQIRKKILKIKFFKTIIGILLTPVSAVICYAAILLLALTNCQA